MRKLSFVLAAAFLALLPSAEAATGTLPQLPPVGAAEAPLFAGGGTPLTGTLDLALDLTVSARD